MTTEDVCSVANVTEESEFYGLLLSSEEYSTTENGKTQVSGKHVDTFCISALTVHIIKMKMQRVKLGIFLVINLNTQSQGVHIYYEVSGFELAVKVIMTATCLTLQTPGPKYYRLEAYSKSSSEAAGIFNEPPQSSEAERCADVSS